MRTGATIGCLIGLALVLALIPRVDSLLVSIVGIYLVLAGAVIGQAVVEARQ